METVIGSGLLRLISGDLLPIVVLILLVYHIFYINKAIEKIEKSIGNLKQEIEALDRVKVDKETHLQDVSGWRWEIQRLEDRMERFFDRLTELIQMLREKP